MTLKKRASKKAAQRSTAAVVGTAWTHRRLSSWKKVTRVPFLLILVVTLPPRASPHTHTHTRSFDGPLSTHSPRPFCTTLSCWHASDYRTQRYQHVAPIASTFTVLSHTAVVIVRAHLVASHDSLSTTPGGSFITTCWDSLSLPLSKHFLRALNPHPLRSVR